MSDLSTRVYVASQKHGLPARIVHAIVLQESGGYAYAFNPEPKYRWFWNVKTNAPFRALSAPEVALKTPASDFPALYGDKDQEWCLQQASIGLMQVMGAVARECGFVGLSLLELTDTITGLDIGCAHLSQLRGRYLSQHGYDGVIAAYNAGSPRRLPDGNFANQGYVNGVKKYMETLS